MKIRRIKTIKDYKSFQDFSWKRFFNNYDFQDTNILYGENGSGKSAVCNILKSLSNYQDFAKPYPEEASVKINDSDYKYSDKGWARTIKKGSILFFDKEFVNKHIHLGNERGTLQGEQEQESGQLIIEFDAKAIGFRKERDRLKTKRDEAKGIKENFYKENKGVLNFSLSKEDKRLFQKYKDKTPQEIEEIKKELIETREENQEQLKTDRKRHKRAYEIQTDIQTLKNKDYGIKISDQPKHQALFNFEITEQAKIETEQALVDKLKEHKEFFERGIDIRKTHPLKCPFCQSETEEENIKKVLKAYHNIYDANYKKELKKFKKKKEALIKELDQALKTVYEFDINEIFLKLKRLDQNYKIKDIYFVEEESFFKKPQTEEIQALKTKIEELDMPNQEKIAKIYKGAVKEVKEINRFFTSLKIFLEKKNKIIKKFKSDNTNQKIQERIDKLNDALTQIETKIDFIAAGFIEKQKQKLEKEESFAKLGDEFKNTHTVYTDAREKYEEYCSEEAFARLLTKIQEYFKNFLFDLKLQLDTEGRTGPTKEFPFAFKILDLKGKKRDFKEGLSEGEWQVLALCFFFAFLDIQRDKDKKKQVLVFDDPITSLDNSNLSALVDLIAEKREGFSQVFVFTHHRTFCKFLHKRFHKKHSTYNILKNKEELGGSFLCKNKDEKKKFIEELETLEKDLKEESSNNGLDLELKTVEYGQYLRYEIERFIKCDLLHWDKEDRFYDVIDGIKKNSNISDDDLDEVKGIYSFCNWTTSHINVENDHGMNQLKTKITTFLEIIDRHRKKK